MGGRGAEISFEPCDKKPCQTKPSIFGTSWSITRPHVLRLIYRLLCWNRVAKPVIMNTIKPTFENILFWAKGGPTKIPEPFPHW